MPLTEPTKDSDSGMPLLPAQSLMGGTRLVDDETGECLVETLVLPNLLIFFDQRLRDGTRLGGSHIISVPFARAMLEHLPTTAEHATECTCERHEGRSMMMLDPDEDL